MESNQTTDDELILDLGGRILRVIAQPTAHTDNDLIVIDEKARTAFLGDLLFVQHLPALDGSLRGWVTLMDEMAKEPFERVVPGHGPASVSWPDALIPQQKYLKTFISDLRKSIATGQSINEASQKAGISERDNWFLFDEFNIRNATSGYAELEWE